ncbi:DUF1007 family protein [Paracoccus aestuarii]|uniref:DUF1007 family protein n=1 Tax=Paracoccus aestuarii TaxID=453842 RepID=A0A418ZRJ5_9RHOB|nr:DUF1007 family protein [Paracoccus aestuarii]RJK99224.1 DUF1007 family protein [Paracoccus aestuarii]WCQ97980.1 DUF1007 family protein [Paracoccus aestuarii]
MTLRPTLAAVTMAALPSGALAHPHVFIDAALSLVYDDQGRLSEVAVEWEYDDFYSFLIIEDMGLDPDGDGVLTPEEQAAIQDFDADWEEGFDGRLYLGVEGRRVALQAPRDFGADYRDGRLVSRHVRPLAAPLDGALPLLVQVYDPEFYVQFAIPDTPVIQGADCAADLRPGDPFASADAYARAVADALDSGIATEAEQEMLVVDIGSIGADAVHVQCEGAP